MVVGMHTDVGCEFSGRTNVGQFSVDHITIKRDNIKWQSKQIVEAHGWPSKYHPTICQISCTLLLSYYNWVGRNPS